MGAARYAQHVCRESNLKRCHSEGCRHSMYQLNVWKEYHGHTNVEYIIKPIKAIKNCPDGIKAPRPWMAKK